MRSAGYDPDIWDVSSKKDLDEVYDYFHRGTGAKDYEFTWLDSVTLFEEAEMDAIMRALVAKNPHRDIHLPDKPQYMLRQNHISMWVRNMRGLPINFGMTAHVMSIGIEDEDEEESTASYLPAIQGSRGALSSKICGYFGIVGRLHVVKERVKLKGGGKRVKTTRVLQVQPSAKWYAKDRFNALGNEIVEPTMADIVAAINSRRKR